VSNRAIGDSGDKCPFCALMLALGILPDLLLVLNVKVKVTGVRYVLVKFLEVVNIAQRQKWLTVKKWVDFFLVTILYDYV